MRSFRLSGSTDEKKEHNTRHYSDRNTAIQIEVRIVILTQKLRLSEIDLGVMTLALCPTGHTVQI